MLTNDPKLLIVRIVMSTNLKSFKSWLKSKNIKPTIIRVKILEYLNEKKTHPTAEAIYTKLEKEIPTISKTSVYNTLNLFVQSGLIWPISVTGKETRYDIKMSPHHHFLCEKCGQIIDLDMECIYQKKGNVDGHKITEWHGHFKGVCNACQKKGKRK
jgi:Fur family peroxide stress response transcriptional regulator